MREKGYTSNTLCGVIVNRILNQKDGTPDKISASLKKRMDADAAGIEKYEKEAKEYKEKKDKEKKERKAQETSQQTPQT